MAPHDDKLSRISDGVTTLQTNFATLTERVDGNILFARCALGLLTAGCIALGGFIYNLRGDVSSIQGQMGKVVQTSYSAQIKLAASAPASPENIAAATTTLREARKENIRIDPGIIQMAGIKFIAATKENESAWKAATTFVDYRSYLNEDYQPKLGPVQPVDTSQHYLTITVKTASGSTSPFTHFEGQVLGSGTAGPESSARYEPIDSTQSPSGIATLLVKLTGPDNILVLDNKRLKNVVISDSVVEYDGGPLIFENVYFVNCSFVLPTGKNTRAFGKAILESASANFDSATVQETAYFAAPNHFSVSDIPSRETA